MSWTLLAILFFLPLQEQKKSTDLVALADSLEDTVEEIRGLRFRKPVAKALRSKDELRKYLLEELKLEYPDGKLGRISRVYSLLGLLPPGYDLEKGILELLTDQVAGYYDPKKKEFYLMEGFPDAFQKIIIVHEMTHALDDQYFDLQKIFQNLKDHEDALTAARSVIEGSGTLVMNRYMMSDPSFMQAMAGPEVMEMMSEQMESLAKTPRYLIRSLAAPYLVGQTFLSRGEENRMTARRGETQDLFQAFSELPRSTEQVLHPEKYWDEEKRDEPVEVVFQGLKGLEQAGWKVIHEDTLGELHAAQLAVEDAEEAVDMQGMMSSGWTNEAAAGWDGDRFYALEKDGTLRILWFSIWDSEKDAKEFAAAFQLPKTNAFVLRKGSKVLIGIGEKEIKGWKERGEEFLGQF